MSALPALQIENLGRVVTGEREKRIVCTLASVYPKAITGRQLMLRVGLPLHSSPVTAFSSLCIAFSNIRNRLPSRGWQAVRSGGAPDALYWLSPGG